mmetsp:Transcript_7831/g.14174  ORF Transcript_7831/g.14174 Transcript_7831/m.14174 type:complete len:86 (+) Transcript_7831:84-341(+)
MRATPPLPRLPNVYLGTMTFGWPGQTSSHVTDSVASQMLNAFADYHEKDASVRIDTARIVSNVLYVPSYCISCQITSIWKNAIYF